jgi:predicted nuclease of predicted toxin-antitoxin system
MRFLLDMNISPAIGDELRADGHDVLHARGAGLGHLPDREIFARASANHRVLISFDLDFGDIAASRNIGGPGVLLLRLRSPLRPHMLNRLRVAITTAGTLLDKGAIVIVEDARIRIRRLDAST